MNMEDVKVGDFVFVTNGNTKALKTVDGLTNTRFYVGADTFRKKDGEGVGIGRYYYLAAIKATKEEADAFRIKVAENKKRIELKEKIKELVKHNIDNFSIEEMEGILKLLEQTK